MNYLLTRELPVEALPAVEAIRKANKRPLSWAYDLIHIPGKGLRYLALHGENTVLACPVGLSIEGEVYCPKVREWLLDESELEGAETIAVQAFVDWWDEQTNPDAAENVIWGER